MKKKRKIKNKKKKTNICLKVKKKKQLSKILKKQLIDYLMNIKSEKKEKKNI